MASSWLQGAVTTSGSGRWPQATNSSGWARELRQLGKSPSGNVYALAFSPDDTMLASADGHGKIALWDAGAGKFVRELGLHWGRVLTVAFSADGKKLASGGDDNVLRVWD